MIDKPDPISKPGGKKKKEPTIHPDSFMTIDEQTRLYRMEKGDALTESNILAFRFQKGLCVCTPRKISFDWLGSGRKTSRLVHTEMCPKWKEWMGEARTLAAPSAERN